MDALQKDNETGLHGFTTSSMTYSEAAEFARKLKGQRVPYAQIEKILKDKGYISARTGKPVGALAIRHMVTQLEKSEQDESKEDAVINVTSPKREKLDDLKKLLAVEGLSVDTQLQLVNMIMKDLKG